MWMCIPVCACEQKMEKNNTWEMFNSPRLFLKVQWFEYLKGLQTNISQRDMLSVSDF